MSAVPAQSFLRRPLGSTESRTALFVCWQPDRCEFANTGQQSFLETTLPKTMLIRVWMRTAVRKEVTSFGTFVSTLCHEFCHHLDFQKFGFRDSWHTRGFYERAAALYHHARARR